MTPARAHANVRPVPFFDYPRLFLPEERELTAIFREVGLRGAFVLQEDLARFERNLARASLPSSAV